MMKNETGKTILQSTLAMTRRQMLLTSAAAAFAAPGFYNTAGAVSPKSGGHLTLGVQGSSTTDTLNPAIVMDAHTYSQNFALRNCLVEVNEGGELVPELAESWDVSRDARKWTFKIRSGIEFHNGKTLDAGDVVASINSHRGEDSKSAVKVLANQITSIKGNGDTVEIELEGGNADFVYLLSSPEFVVLPSSGGGVDFASGQGTGAYVLENFEPGMSSMLKKNPDYWKSGTGHFDSAEILAVNDGTARINGLNSRSLDVVNRVDPKLANRLSKIEHVNVLEYGGTLHYSFAMNTKTAPFDNNDIRLALKYSVDRERLLSTVLSGHGSVGNDQPIGPANRYFNPDIPQRSYDPDKAAFHLKKAGRSSLDVTLHTSPGAFEGAVDAAVLLSEAAKKAGINVQVKRSPADGYWSDVWLKKPWFATWWGGRPTEDWMFTIGYAEGAAWNDTNFSNVRFNKLLIEARSELDDARRREMYGEMQMILHKEGGAVIPVFANHIAGVSKSIGYKPIAPTTYELSNYRAIERWWRES